MTTLSTLQLSVKIGDKTICHDFSWEAHAQQVWGILGQNGSGKTTLLHTLAGLRPAQSGNITIEKKNITTLSAKTLAQYRGILFQEDHTLFPQTVWEYCLAARYPHLNYLKQDSAHDRAIVKQALQDMELHLFDTRLVTHLSGGEKRRLAVATLIAQTPQIYFLDEPTNHLDMRYQIYLLNYLKQLAKNQSAIILMTLHDVNLAQQFCDKLLLLFPEGEVLSGTPEEVLTIANLSRLYQYPMRRIREGENALWWPDVHGHN
jgi:iron complex transport system ATP-binding protein